MHVVKGEHDSPLVPAYVYGWEKLVVLTHLLLLSSLGFLSGHD